MSNQLYDFIAYQTSRGREVTPEIRQVAREIEEEKVAKLAYKNRPLRCKLGIHSPIPSVWGGWFRKTCVICMREQV